MSIPTTHGRKWKRDGEYYTYVNKLDMVLGRILYDSATRTYKVEKIDSKGQFVMLGHGFTGLETAGKALVDNLA